MKYEAKSRIELVLNETKQPVELIKCACGNDVFYFSVLGDRICACCTMQQGEAEAAKAERDAAINELNEQGVV